MALWGENSVDEVMKYAGDGNSGRLGHVQLVRHDKIKFRAVD